MSANGQLNIAIHLGASEGNGGSIRVASPYQGSTAIHDLNVKPAELMRLARYVDQLVDSSDGARGPFELHVAAELEALARKLPEETRKKLKETTRLVDLGDSLTAALSNG